MKFYVDFLGLRGVKRELLRSLTQCGTAQCKDVLSQYEIGKLDLNDVDYNQVINSFQSINHINTQ